MVVADSPFIASQRTRRLDASDETHLGEDVERVIHGLVGDLGEVLPHCADDSLGVCMRVSVHRLQNRDPLFGHAQRTVPQGCGTVLGALLFFL